DFPGPVILAVNKVDRVVEKSRLLPFLQELGTRRAFAEIIPVSATKGTNLEVLERAVADRLPEADFLFDADQVTTVSQRFIAAELIREQLIRRLHQELPYSLTVEIEGFQEEGRLVRIDAAIWVERPGQKGIVIGRGGAILKEAGRAAREAMERLFERKVFLQTWVKVREDWSDDERALRSLGFGEPDA
ncbi:MAG: GTPase Era, partial [Candidatus Competibacteraceae bacterium]|nr:GTPase Era [Candidatus Competibacteraceae bacterium]